jgi:hypothetical protein
MTRVLIIALALTAPACGTAAPETASGSFPADPLATVASSSGKLLVEVRGAPQPLQTGTSRVQFKIRDASTGAPTVGLAISVTPWMPAMGHGASVTPSVVETEPGVYVVSDVSLFMPGTWQLRSSLSATEHVEPSFDVR